MERVRALTLPRGRPRIRVGFDPSEPLLIPHRISSKFGPPNGADIAFVALSSGRALYCKDDKDGRPIRAVEMFCTRLAGEAGILTPDCAIVEDDGGRTYFGSVDVGSIASIFEVRGYLSSTTASEIGAPDPWLGRYLSGLYAYDLFVGNVDRSIQNFLMATADRQLRAFDFASSDLKKLSGQRFSIENTSTLSLGRRLRKIHGFDLEAALEMIRRLEGIPVKVVRRFTDELPRDWLEEVERESLCGGWEQNLGARLAALSAGLRDGSLL